MKIATKQKSNFKRKKSKSLFIILIIAIIIFLIRFFLENSSSDYFQRINHFLFNKDVKNNSGNNKQIYQIIKMDKNKNYFGKDQEKVENKDGYFTKFTTVEKNKKVYIEYKQNYGSWKEHQYWGGTMEENGCGITALAIILSGYNKKYTPEDLRKMYLPSLDYDTLSDKLKNTYKIKNSGFYYDNAHLSTNSIKKHLQTNKPILICLWTKPSNNRWTTSSHYMVLLATDNENMVYVSNPNGLENDSKSSGWYNFDEVVPYIAKAIYIEE